MRPRRLRVSRQSQRLHARPVNQQKYQWASVPANGCVQGHRDQRLDNSIPKRLLTTFPKQNWKSNRCRRKREEIDGAAWYSEARQMRPSRLFLSIPARTGFVYLGNGIQRRACRRARTPLQISLKQSSKMYLNLENSPKSMALQEGWALYVESICQELRCEDPLQRFGQLNNEMLRRAWWWKPAYTPAT